MKVAITGSNGQLGRALVEELSHRHQVVGLHRPQFDLTSLESVRKALKGIKPDVLVHSAAYTDVDGCELNPELAYRINALGTRFVALACREVGSTMVYVSTNCVFDGNATRPYLEFDQPSPISVYGRTKLAGEREVQLLLPEHYIVRTSWLFGVGGNNFPYKIYRAARVSPSLSLVYDEVASPTYARDLARAIGSLVETGAYGTYHLTNLGECSRFDFAAEVLRILGLTSVELRPVPLSEYSRPSRPPAYSALANMAAKALGIQLRPWQEALELYLAEDHRFSPES
jgi:dTDP-4-dehydrorhamnose reductase